MSVFAWVSVFLLMKMQLKREGHWPPPSKVIGHRRFGQRLHKSRTRRPFLLLWLIVSQNIIPSVQALQLGRYVHEWKMTEVTDDWMMLSPSYDYVTWRPQGGHVKLSPPGNPDETYCPEKVSEKHIADLYLRQYATTYCNCLMNQINVHFEARRLQHRLAALVNSFDGKVDYDTEFVCDSTDVVVRSTLLGKANMPRPDTLLPEWPETSPDSRLERCVAVDCQTSNEFVNWQMPQVHPQDALGHTFEGKQGVEVAPSKQEHVFYIDADVDVMDDRHGLSSAWQIDAMPTLLDCALDYHPDSYAALDTKNAIPNVEYTDLYIYTDGSAGLHDDAYLSTWAFVVFEGPNNDHDPRQMRLVQWAADYNDNDPLSPMWIGSTQYSIRAGEAEAIAWALLWMQSHDDRPLHIGSDALTVLNATTGTWGFHPDDGLLLRVRAIYQLVWAIRNGKDLYLPHAHQRTHWPLWQWTGGYYCQSGQDRTTTRTQTSHQPRTLVSWQ